jgi:predicted DNA-binding transcriptional regulator AlpA
MSDTQTTQRWLNAKQVAARYGCGRVTIYRMVKRGQRHLTHQLMRAKRLLRRL